MSQNQRKQLNEYLTPFQCSCGKEHKTALNHIAIGQGVVKHVPAWLKEKGYQKIYIIADETTDKIAGEKVRALLEEASIPFVYSLIPHKEVVPEEEVLGGLLMRFHPTCDFVLGVGSGTINDISRFISFQTGKAYGIVATAPSMDGYASTVAPLITNNLKTTYEAQVPSAIFGDTLIMQTAPENMIAAGFGDILGKYTCLCDWKLSAIVNGEYYCPVVNGMMEEALQRTIDCKDKMKEKDPDAMQDLMEALVLAGIAMSYAGNSRPASGCEHHLSHFWEMNFLFTGKKAVLHGTKVGIGTILALRLYEKLAKEKLDFKAILNTPAIPMDAAWEKEIHRAFDKAASEIITLEHKAHKNAPEKRNERLRAYEAHRDEIQALIEKLPAPQEISALLKEVGGITKPQEIGLEKQVVEDSILYAKEVRDRYTLLQYLWDTNLLTPCAKAVAEEYR